MSEQEHLAVEGETQIQIFQKKEIRRCVHQGEWWFSVKDVLEALVDTTDGARYARGLRSRDPGLKDTWDEIVRTIPLETSGGVKDTNFINIEGIFRVMQSVPSKKAEPFKKWLAKVGFERLQEIENPELAVKRAMTYYRAKGYDEGWIEARIQNKASREKLENEWAGRGIKRGVEYAVLTDAISIETFGMNTGVHKALKGLGKSHGLRDNMTPIELTLTTLGEQATVEIVKARNSRGLHQNKEAAKSGGQIARGARLELERTIGQRVVSKDNYLTDRQKKNISLPKDAEDSLRRMLNQGDHENP